MVPFIIQELYLIPKVTLRITVPNISILGLNLTKFYSAVPHDFTKLIAKYILNRGICLYIP